MASLHVPDLWQTRAVAALKEGADVVVHAPTGAGKTFVFESFVSGLKGQAVFTVPTRALANDKLAEWRARGWDVGICTGDVADRLEAHVLVATLETQRGRLLRREGPRLLAVDEYQMLGDSQRGADYELALALAPASTQLLLLSGSVGNPQAVTEWLRRLGRKVELVSTFERPVPLDEADLQHLGGPRGEKHLRGYWPRLVARALHNDLGPILLFAPRRQAAEDLARDLAAQLPPGEPLTLSPEQAHLAGENLARLLRRRIAYHHSGLSYAVRSGLIEPLAKAGQLRAVIATNGLAAGVNFSLRSVLVTDTRYAGAHGLERHLQPEELLQMFGRAGRRGLDECGWVLVAPDKPRLADGRPRALRRPAAVDWPSLLAVMHEAARREEPVFEAAARVTRSLFSTEPLRLGFEESAADGPRACGLWVDAERARFARPTSLEMLNSRGEWEPATPLVDAPLGQARLLEQLPPNGVPHPVRLRHAIRDAIFWKAREVGRGALCRLGSGEGYGREFAVATHAGGDEPARLAPSLRAGLREARVALPPGGRLPRAEVEAFIAPHVGPLSGGGVFRGLVQRSNVLYAQADLSAFPVQARVDRHGVALVDPPLRQNHPVECGPCPRRAHCTQADAGMTPALAWRKLGLIEPDGTPTTRGVIFSWFHRGEGLAIAAALEEPTYKVEDLVYDLANLRAGHRFTFDGEHVSGGRLGWLCARTFARAEFPGYLDSGLPPDYGDGASDVARALHADPTQRSRFLNESLRPGDIERMLIEWRSLLRQIAHLPDYDHERWRALQHTVRTVLGETKSAPPPAPPPLLPAQRRACIHRV
ncbi:MAG: DEAD/DEAH box helicase [Verrucomicrobia bacterium]|nr:DEAD/DEAH box helicase [Verrucomicrobiota bacterium]